MTTKTAFDEALKTLTPEQRQAVETVEGPVMVLAGPGTGKTHVLTLRIASILRTTQAKPDAILALTFTDSAARTMHRRLAALIGAETARKVTIATFHGFAELVRNEYPDAFAAEADHRLMGDVEETLLLREAIDTADIDMLRPAKAPYTYLRDLRALYDALRREGVTLNMYRAWGARAAQELAADESLKYKRGEHAGELTKAGQEKVVRFEKVEEAARIFERYQELKDERRLTDFSDMLTGVIERIEGDEALRSDLQERYQYLLADEHQDANALQHRLLELFAYDDHPNLFVVGDEKQAIYRFQGAEIGAFKTFTDTFPRAVVITLTSSFRSYQHILDAAHEVVANTGEHAALTATRTGVGKQVSRIVADDPLDERAKVAALIERHIASGVPPHEIAIIARTNDTADLFASVLTARGLSVLRAGDLSLTERPVMRALMALMSYVADPTQLGSLREALLAPWWGVSTTELLKLLRMTNDKDLITNIAHVYPDTAAVLTHCVRESLVQTPAACFSYVFTQSGARDYFLAHAEHLDDIALVRALMMHLESVAQFTEAATFAETFAVLEKAREHGLSPVKISVTEREGFITIITAHKAKGMEFRYVFIPDCTENAWEKGGKATMIPSPFENKQTLDDARRLFYVALTRAKDHAYLSYASTSAEGRERHATNLMPTGLLETKVKSESLPLLHTTSMASGKIRELTEYYLATDSLSPSAVNDYLESPALFFARRVLRIHEPPVPALIYGNAMHAALAAALSGASEDEAHATLARVFERSLLPRDAIFEKLHREARAAFTAILPELATLGTPTHVEKIFSLVRYVDDTSVTLAGKIDAVFTRGGQLLVADFKTGSNVSAKNEAYARQLALYAAMLAAHKEPVESGELLAVSDKGIKRVPVPVGKMEQDAALAELDSMVRELRLGEWRKGAASDYDALLALVAT
ncbi:MAG: hypothetical protein B7X04_01640 [Parcubacteria group bacterium 21-54-25]|nr:MAG: hypothetical protein B7X04_01640 [Parcubacteria group bacterium 21-54-25]HQU07627.1 ATP-dependent DNA helicase [Candidatus Paceibacterota bacterium]